MSRLTCLPPRVRPSRTTRVSIGTTAELQRLGSSKWETLRVQVLTEAKGLCQCSDCRSTGAVRLATEVDHIVPLWAGGSNAAANLQAISSECHRAKSEREAQARARGDGSSVV